MDVCKLPPFVMVAPARGAMRLLALTLVLAITGSGCGGTPTAPDRHGSPVILIDCGTETQSTLQCRARVVCGLYPCPDGTPTEVTSTATWSIDDALVAKITGQGTIVSVAPGDTVVRAAAPTMSAGSQPIAVFAAMMPLPTHQLVGYVYEGPSWATGTEVDGARIEVVDGLIKGRTATSGLPPEPVPGWFTPSVAPGVFFIQGVPPGTIRLRVSHPGYVPAEHDATFTLLGGPAALNVPLQRE
jgi:hypothetical protein